MTLAKRELALRGGLRGRWVAEPDDDGLTEAQIETALAQTPRGALALAGLTVGLLLLAWLAIYLFVFLPRGQVG